MLHAYWFQANSSTFQHKNMIPLHHSLHVTPRGSNRAWPCNQSHTLFNKCLINWLVLFMYYVTSSIMEEYNSSNVTALPYCCLFIHSLFTYSISGAFVVCAIFLTSFQVCLQTCRKAVGHVMISIKLIDISTLEVLHSSQRTAMDSSYSIYSTNIRYMFLARLMFP